MPHDPYKALYIHIPFCAKRCAYCDFATQAMPRESERIDQYVEQLVMDLRKYSREGELADIESIYIGGGTPTHIGLSRLSSLLYAISVSLDTTRPDLEFTLEANPESLDGNIVRDAWALGVNRLSIGVQSFSDEVLKILGRIHDAERAKEAIREASERFENLSIDLMCGIPGQNLDDVRSSLEQALSLGVKHVSMYPLTIEARTAFDRAVLAGEMEEPDEDEAAAHMQEAARILGEAGFVRYEVASYALPGFESKHNSSYWTGVPYIGIGESAVTMTQDAERRMRVMNGQVVDDLNREQMEAEDLMLGMRRSCGITEARLQAACEILPEARQAMEELCEQGLVEHTEGRWRPTERGWLLGNELYGLLLDLAP